MGLDMYAYARPPRKRNNDEDLHIAEWRKHNRLQGWMQELWESKGCPNADTEGNPMGDFNSVEMKLTLADIYALEDAILTMTMPESNGFFWGSDSFFWADEDGNDYPEDRYYYLESDLQFVDDAKKMLDKGYRVFYSCWY
jgi:hypothetical protein